MPDPPLYVRDDVPGIAFVPMPIERFGNPAKLDQEVAREILGLDLATLFLPELDQGGLIAAHDDSGIRAADKAAAVKAIAGNLGDLGR
jgi:hypothetical protein